MVYGYMNVVIIEMNDKYCELYATSWFKNW